MAKYVYPFFKAQDGVKRPWVPVRITNLKSGSHIDLMALLDTGADKCVFPKLVADSCGVGLKRDSIRQEDMQGIADNPIPTWIHPFRIDLLAPDRKGVLYKTKDTEVGCVEHDKMPPILGFANFMVYFKITFNYQSKKIIIDDQPGV